MADGRQAELNEAGKKELKGFVGVVSDELKKNDVNVDHDILEKAVTKGREHLLGCSSCANGWHW